jgi:2-polyprenyl-6-methoxyphenol hydroxylase-like FAD-dependent oxidoreductase
MSTTTESKRVVIVGSSFAGLTAAFELRKRTRGRHPVVVLDPRPDFTFIPSLIWVPFGEPVAAHAGVVGAHQLIDALDRLGGQQVPA